MTQLARAVVALGGLALAVSVLLPWDTGLRDVPGGFVGEGLTFESEPASAIGLLVPFGLALLATAAAALHAAARGAVRPAVTLAVALAAVATMSLVLRQLSDALDGVSLGSVVGTAALLVTLEALLVLPRASGSAPVGLDDLMLGAGAWVLLTVVVHDGYRAVDYSPDAPDVPDAPAASDGVLGVLNTFTLPPAASWPESWLVEAWGARTVVDLGLVVVATAGLGAAALAVTRGLPRVAAFGLAGLAGLVLACLLIVAIGPDPGVSGGDRFPDAAFAALLLVAIAGAGLRATRPRSRAAGTRARAS